MEGIVAYASGFGCKKRMKNIIEFGVTNFRILMVTESS